MTEPEGSDYDPISAVRALPELQGMAEQFYGNARDLVMGSYGLDDVGTAMTNAGLGAPRSVVICQHMDAASDSRWRMALFVPDLILACYASTPVEVAAALRRLAERVEALGGAS